MPSIDDLRDRLAVFAAEQERLVRSVVLDARLAADVAQAELDVAVVEARMVGAPDKPAARAGRQPARRDGDPPEPPLAEQAAGARARLEAAVAAAKPHTLDLVFRRLPVAEWLEAMSPLFALPQAEQERRSVALADDLIRRSWLGMRLGGEPVEGATVDDVLGGDPPLLSAGDRNVIGAALVQFNNSPVARLPLAPGGFSRAAS
jgi:hypothetical protein